MIFHGRQRYHYHLFDTLSALFALTITPVWMTRLLTRPRLRYLQTSHSKGIVHMPDSRLRFALRRRDLLTDLENRERNRNEARAHSLTTRTGLSLLEVMIALAILATVFGSVASSMATMENSRRLALERQGVSALGQSFLQRVSTTRWSRIVEANTGSSTFWAEARFEYDVVGPPTSPVTIEQPGYAYQDLVNRGMIDENIKVGADDLEVFLEYYRARGREVQQFNASGDPTITEPRPGVLDPWGNARSS